MKNLKYILTFLLTFSIFISCNQLTGEKSEKDIENEEVVDKSKNVSETTSTDIDKLGKLLDLTTYRPSSVKYKYTYIDNSEKNERISIPGPSDYYLEALLGFDSINFRKINEFEFNLEWVEQNYKKEEFDFDWLPKNVITELHNSHKDYRGHPDFFFKSGVNGKCWYLKNKILLKTNSN